MEPVRTFLKISKNKREERNRLLSEEDAPPHTPVTGRESRSHLMEEGAVCHGDAQPTEAHAQDHVVRSVIAVASAVAHKKSPNGFPAENHAGRSRQKRGLNGAMEPI